MAFREEFRMLMLKCTGFKTPERNEPERRQILNNRALKNRAHLPGSRRREASKERKRGGRVADGHAVYLPVINNNNRARG